MEATERSLDLERLETRERLVARAEDDVAEREARAAEEVDRQVVAACLNLEREFKERLELIKVEAEGRTTALKSKLDEVTWRGDAAQAALGAAQAELASSRAEVLLLHQRVDATEAVVRRNEDEIRQW